MAQIMLVRASKRGIRTTENRMDNKTETEKETWVLQEFMRIVCRGLDPKT